jgi:hypothetical protein
MKKIQFCFFLLILINFIISQELRVHFQRYCDNDKIIIAYRQNTCIKPYAQDVYSFKCESNGTVTKRLCRDSSCQRFCETYSIKPGTCFEGSKYHCSKEEPK